MVKKKIDLTENARKVLEKRYLIKDEKGEVVETPEELFQRVARFIAKGDERYGVTSQEVQATEEKFHSIMANLEFMPNSPTLMNAGKDLGQLSACFTKEQKILLNPGYKNIDQIKIGDKIVTSKGRIKKVLELHQRKYRGQLYTVNVQGLMKPTLKVTEEHPILAIKKEELVCKRIKVNKCNGSIKKYCLKTPKEYRMDCGFIGQFFQPKWTPIKELEEKDFVVINTNKEIKDINEIRIENYLTDDIYLKKGEILVVKGRPNEGKEISNKIEVDNNFLRLIGYWLADGSLSERYGKYSVIRFAFNLKEKEFCKEVKKIMKEKFNLTTKEEFSKTQKTIQLRFNSIIVAELFYKLFGEGFNGKRLPGWVSTLPLEKQFNLIVGLFRGDGCYSKGEKQDVIFVSLSNENLANGVWNILLRLGYNFNINHTKPKGGTKEAYRISAAPAECKELAKAIMKKEYRERKAFPRYIRTGDIILRSIDKIESKIFDGDVYNLEVEKDHSYLANGVAVHNCFVLSIDDSMEDIFEAIKNTAMVHKSGGGTGFSFSRLRPKNSQVKSTGGVSSGPVSFMKVFNAATEAVKQGGVRRGANMGILRVDHPDILEFITCKEDNKQITNFNISIVVTDDFMEKLEKGEDYDLINPATKKVVKQLNTKEVFDLIVKMAWKNGEPGVIFIDRMNEFNPTPKIGTYESTNPCGEQILLPNESCNLGSINLSRMIRERGGGFEVDWERLGRTVDSAVHFLDNVIDQNKFPLPEIQKATLANRKIGLGVMGWADLLIMLGIPYNSEDAVRFAEEVMKFVQDRSKEASRKLAKQRGAFPNFKKSIYYDREEPLIRNATTTTIAPTGTISIIAGSCSSGIEPLFALSYYRQVMDNNKLVEINPYFEKVAKEREFFSRELLERIAQKGSIQDFSDIPEDVRRIFVISHDITPEWHVRMQGVFQKYTDNAVSKTVNFPNEATQRDVEKAYGLAYKLGCKGVTIYRDRSREEQVLNIAKREEDKPPAKIELERTPRKRPNITKGRTFKIGTGCGNLYITINEDEYGLCEVFSQMGKSGGCAASQSEATSRLVSLTLRSGIAVEAILKQLCGIRCPSPLWVKGGMILSCPDAIAKAIEKYLEENKKGREIETVSYSSATSSRSRENRPAVSISQSRLGNVVGVCPDCGNALIYIEGCMTCIDSSCGYSKCS